MTGIYKITNTENNKVYIGQSTKIEDRWEQHLDDLRSNSHHSKSLQYEYNMFGEDAFRFEVIENFDFADEPNMNSFKVRLMLLFREKFYMTKYNAFNIEHGYNYMDSFQNLMNYYSYPKSNQNKYYDQFEQYSGFVKMYAFDFSSKAKPIKDIRIVCFKSSVSKNVKGENTTYLKRVYEALAPQSFVDLYSYHAFLLGLCSMGYLEPTDHDFLPRPKCELFQFVNTDKYQFIAVQDKNRDKVKELIDEIVARTNKYIPKSQLDIDPNGKFTPKFIQKYWDSKKRPSNYDLEVRRFKNQQRQGR